MTGCDPGSILTCGAMIHAFPSTSINILPVSLPCPVHKSTKRSDTHIYTYTHIHIYTHTHIYIYIYICIQCS